MSEKQTYNTTHRHFSFWGRGDLGTVLNDIHIKTGTYQTTPIHSYLGTWGDGDSSLVYIPTETGTDTPNLYTLISGDVGTRGHFSRIYRC